MNGQEFCPQCLQKGVSSPLLQLESPNGRLRSLCSNPHCRYPFSSYESLRTSITLLSTEADSNAVEATPDVDLSSMDEFLTELLGCPGQDADLDASRGLERERFAVDCNRSLKNKKLIKCHLLSERQNSSMIFSDTELRHSPGSLVSEPQYVTSNYMLPRYLADDIKRATSSYHGDTYCHSSQVSHKSLRNANGSCDSGISVTSTFGLPSARVTYGEYVGKRSPSPDTIPTHPVTNNRDSDHLCTTPQQTHPSKPILHVDRMIDLYKKRFRSNLN